MSIRWATFVFVSHQYATCRLEILKAYYILSIDYGFRSHIYLTEYFFNWVIFAKWLRVLEWLVTTRPRWLEFRVTVIAFIEKTRYSSIHDHSDKLTCFRLPPSLNIKWCCLTSVFILMVLPPRCNNWLLRLGRRLFSSHSGLVRTKEVVFVASTLSTQYFGVREMTVWPGIKCRSESTCLSTNCLFTILAV
jgi:hypothetical protein